MFGDPDLQQILPIISHQSGDIMTKSIEGTLMDRTGGFSIHHHFRIRHHAFEDDIDASSLPIVRNGEAAAIEALLLPPDTIFCKAVIVFSKSL